MVIPVWVVDLRPSLRYLWALVAGREQRSELACLRLFGCFMHAKSLNTKRISANDQDFFPRWVDP